MTAQDKAKDLLVKHLEIIPDYLIQDNKDAGELARINALISVDEIIEELIDFEDAYSNSRIYYFVQVKQELEKLKE